MTTTPYVDFLGEIHQLHLNVPVVIGRDADITIDDNKYLHRRFLEIVNRESMIWIVNVGANLAATVADADGLVQAWVAPGARFPVVFPRAGVWFTAGPTTYEFDVVVPGAPYASSATVRHDAGETTIGRAELTPEQRLLVIALAEDILRRGNRGAGEIAANSVAAERLGWTITKFNRRLDNVCEKLSKLGVGGLHGDQDRLAVSRRARLIEYSLATRLVSALDLPLLDDMSATGIS